MERARPYRPAGEQADTRTTLKGCLQRLRERGAEGITTGELIRRGLLRPTALQIELGTLEKQAI